MMTTNRAIKSIFTIVLVHTAFMKAAFGQDQDKSERLDDSCPDDDTALPCKNGATCKMGIANFGYHGSLDLPFLNNTHIDFMHCECLAGFTGVMCEHHVETCGNDEHACFNGATCVRLPDESGHQMTYRCDCSTTLNHTSFAGHMCEHSATSFCEYGVAVSRHAFCVNGGVCKDVIVKGEKHQGCSCPEGYSGQHCEYTTATAPKMSSSESNSSSKSSSDQTEKTIAFFFLIAVITGCVIFALVFVVRQVRKDKRKSAAQQKPVEKADDLTLEADGGTMPSQNETELQDVKIQDTDDGEFI